jgi:uncharacterized membrane protein YagU involved in acid resistance
MRAWIHGVPPVRVFHAVASGLVGREAALAGGAATAALGVFLHFVIAFGAAGTYLGVSHFWRLLMDRPLVAGPLYGIVVYWFMQLVVIPLSAINPRPQQLSNRLIGIGIHIVCVGMTTWILRKFPREGSVRRRPPSA